MSKRIDCSLVLLITLCAACAGALPSVGDETSTGGTASTGEVTADVSATTTETGEADAPGCGNGIVEAGETCDDAGESTNCDVDCTEVVCGDLVINAMAGEECEGEDLGGGACEGLGFDGGSLSCGGGCAYDISGCADLPAPPVLELSFSQVKRFDFGWAAVAGAERYEIWESTSPGDSYVQIGGDIDGEEISMTMPLHLRFEASYVLRACNVAGCTDSAAVEVVGSLAEAVGYVKASNTWEGDEFGFSVALSGDGDTLAVGAPHEDSGATGIGGDQADDSALDAGAVYVYVRDDMDQWSLQGYVKASNTDANDYFGSSVALDGDGNVLAVGAWGESSEATGIGGDQTDDSAPLSGAVYVFVRDAMGQWSQQAYVKASNTDAGDYFGYWNGVALSGDGKTLAVGAILESSNASGIDGDQTDDMAPFAGAVYVFARDAEQQWSQQAYVKASNTDAVDYFGRHVVLSGDGNTLAVGAVWEDSNAIGINGDQEDDSSENSGAVYVFVRNAMAQWSQQAYVKASNTGAGDYFGGHGLALSESGNTLAVGADQEDSSAIGSGGDQVNDLAPNSGSVYVFVRDVIGWSQQAYVKASNTESGDEFGAGVSLSNDGSILVVGARREDSNANGIDDDQADDSADNSGAVYVYVWDTTTDQWSYETYVKASNSDTDHHFGVARALSGDGTTLAIGAPYEDSNAMGIGGDQTNTTNVDSGAVYLY